MVLEVKVGATVIAVVEGHSAVNGAVIPNGSVALTSNDTAVATVPETTPVPDGGAQVISIPVTVLAPGSTDIHMITTLADGTKFEDTGTLIVDQPQPGLLSVSLTLKQQ